MVREPQTEKEILFVNALHKSLVTKKIITNPRVIQCGTYYSRERGHFTYRVRCRNNQKECPDAELRNLLRKIRDPLRTKECLKEGWIYLYDHWNPEAQENRFPKVTPRETGRFCKETKESIWMETDLRVKSCFP